jgi:hypothetical protein
MVLIGAVAKGVRGRVPNSIIRHVSPELLMKIIFSDEE